MYLRALEQSDLRGQEAVAMAAAVARSWYLASVLAVSALGLSLVVMLGGWGLQVPLLVRWIPDAPAMVPLTALGMMLTATGLLLWHALRRPRYLIAVVCLILTVAMQPNIDLTDNGAFLAGDSLSLTTRLSLGFHALLLMCICPGPLRDPLRRVFYILATLAVLLPLPSLIDMILAPTTNAAVFSSLPTVVCLELLGLALLFSHDRPGWPQGILVVSPSRRIMRDFLPLAVIGPTAMSALYLKFQPDMAVAHAEGLSLLSAIGTAAAVAVILVTVRRLAVEASAERVAHDRELRASKALAELEARRLESAAERYGALSRVTGGIAHDINNLLAVVQGNLELIERLTEKADVRECAEDALKAIDRGAGIIDRLRSYGGKSILAPQEFDVASTLRAMHGRLSMILPPEITLVPPPPSSLAWVNIDRSALAQALLGLVSNARDAMDGAGRIRMDARVVNVGDPGLGDGPDDVFHVAPGLYSLVTVRDSGPGIDPSILPRVIDPFFTTKGMARYSGLGLSMVYGFCRQSGGYLRIENGPSGGARVMLYFPAVAAEPTEQPVLQGRADTHRGRAAEPHDPLAGGQQMNPGTA